MSSQRSSQPPQGAYFLNRDWQSSARLSLQHYVCYTRMGHLLHPKVEAFIKSRSSPKILDLGTGTGIWAVEASRTFPAATVTGLDIADNQFPPRGTLSKNLNFAKYSFFDPIPEDLMGVFDVVHISFINAALYRGGRDTVMKNVSQLLKPGGWIQWREILSDPDILIDPNTLQPAGELQSTVFADKMVGGFFSFQDWVKDMPKYLADEGGFVDNEMVVPAMDPTLLSLETQLLLWNTLEAMTTMGQALGTQEAQKGAADAIADTEKKVAEGNVLHWHFMFGVGRKPE
jgi:SAM-dependent methyltransferase